MIYLVLLIANIIFLDRMIGIIDTEETLNLALIVVHSFAIGSVTTSLVEEWRSGKNK